jgi:hypothetical protein
LEQARQTIGKLRADGGGDMPEAVFAGLVTATQELSWRAHARRIAVLVGDAPPHGVGCHGDAFAQGCPSGETIESTSAKLECANIRLYAIGLTNIVESSFGLLSSLTGGSYFAASQAPAAMQSLQKVLTDEFGQLDFDQEVYRHWTTHVAPTTEEIATQLDVAPVRVAAAISRLYGRDLLQV